MCFNILVSIIIIIFKNSTVFNYNFFNRVCLMSSVIFMWQWKDKFNWFVKWTKVVSDSSKITAFEDCPHLTDEKINTMFTREFTNSVFGTRDQVASCDNALFCIYAELLKPFRYSWPFPLEHVVNREILKDAKLSIYLDASSFSSKWKNSCTNAHYWVLYSPDTYQRSRRLFSFIFSNAAGYFLGEQLLTWQPICKRYRWQGFFWDVLEFSVSSCLYLWSGDSR